MRVPALSAGAGGSSTFTHAVPQQVLKQAEIQALFLGNQVLLTPVEANSSNAFSRELVADTVLLSLLSDTR